MAETCITCLTPYFWQLHLPEHLYKAGRSHPYTKCHCCALFLVVWLFFSGIGAPNSGALGYRSLIHASVYKNCSIVFTCWSTVPLSIHKESFHRTCFFVVGVYKQDFVHRNLPTELSYWGDSLCAGSIICASCISGKIQMWTVAKSVDALEESLSHIRKRGMLCSL